MWAQEAHNFRGVTLQITQGHTIVLRIHHVTAVIEASEGDYLMTVITHRRTEIYPLHNAGLVDIEHLVPLLEGGQHEHRGLDKLQPRDEQLRTQHLNVSQTG